MKDYVLDANAVLLFLDPERTKHSEEMKNLFLLAQRGQARLFISVVNLGEVFYTLLKKIGEQRTHHVIQILQNGVTVVEANLEKTIHAATVKHQYDLGYADSFAAALTLSLKATLVSADPDFEKLGKSLKWLRLPKFTGKTR